jgi:hypothetical protein
MTILVSGMLAILAAVQAPAATHGRQAGGASIPRPSRAAQMRAWRTIDEPLLAEQVRPGRRLEPSECVVFLDRYHATNRAQAAAVRRAMRAWEARVVAAEGATGANQLISSSINPLLPTPAVLKQAWASWCVANAPR